MFLCLAAEERLCPLAAAVFFQAFLRAKILALPFKLPRQIFREEHATNGVAHGFAPQRFAFFLGTRVKTRAGKADAPAAEHSANRPREDLLNHHEEDDVEEEIENSAHC